MIDKRTFKKSVGAPLVEEGFVRKGQSWYKVGSGVTAVVDLQKHPYAERYYVNIAFLIHCLTHEEFLPEHKCHIRLRADSLCEGATETLERCFRLDSNEFDTEEQVNCIREFVEQEILPFCQNFMTIEALAARYLSGGFSNALVRREAVEFFRGTSFSH